MQQNYAYNKKIVYYLGMQSKKTLSKLQVAEALGIHSRNVVSLVRRGIIPGPVRGLCPMPSLRKPRLEEMPEWDREAVLKAWAQRGEV
jgi:hypothetical protein